MQSPFNANSFMEITYRAELDTVFTPVPDGEYLAQLKRISFRVVRHDSINPPWGIGLGFEGQWQLLEDDYGYAKAAAEVTGMPNPVVRQGFLMDVIDPSKIELNQASLDTGKNRNIRLGILLKAAGYNKKAGWRLNQLLNMIAGVRVGQGKPSQDGDTYPEVRAVVSIQEWKERQILRTTALRQQANSGTAPQTDLLRPPTPSAQQGGTA